MKNCDELRAELAMTFERLKAGEIKPGEAAELANLAGKMIGSAKVQVEYYALRKESPRIEWLESPNDQHEGPEASAACRRSLSMRQLGGTDHGGQDA